MTAELYIGTEKVLLYSGDDLDIGLTVRTSDIQNPDERRGAVFTERIRIPWSGANNEAIGFLGYDSLHMQDDTLDAFEFRIDVDGQFFAKGKGILVSSARTRNPEFLEIALLSGNLDWATQLEGKQLNELVLGTHEFSRTNVEASWSESYSVRNCRYFPVNYGDWQGSTYVSMDDIRPHASFRAMVEKAFEGVGYTINSDFIEADFFTRLYWIFVGRDFALTDEQVDDLLFSAQRVTSNQILTPGGSDTINFNDDSTGDLFDNGGNYDEATNNWYLVPHAARMNFTAGVRLTTTDDVEFLIELIVDRGGGETVLDSDTLFLNNTSGLAAVTSGDYDFQEGDKVFVRFTDNQLGGSPATDAEVVFGTDTVFNNTAQDPIVEGYDIVLADWFPEDDSLTQKWFITQIAKAFRLEFWSNVVRRQVWIEPWGDIAKEAGNFVDWTNKADLSERITDRPIDSELKREQFWSYAHDPNDQYVESLEKRIELPFLSGIVDLGERFPPGRDENQIEFAPTAMAVDTDVNETGFTIHMPVLWKDYEGSQPAQTFDFLPRMIYYAGLQTSTEWRWFENSNVETSFPQARSVQLSGSSATETSLSFGDIVDTEPNPGTGLLGTNDNGLITRFQEPIYDMHRRGRIREMHVDLNRFDVETFDVRKLVKLVLNEGTSLWRVNIIDRFKVLRRESTRVELMPALNLTPPLEFINVDGDLYSNWIDLPLTAANITGGPHADMLLSYRLSDLPSAVKTHFYANVRSDGGDVRLAEDTSPTDSLNLHLHEWDYGSQDGVLFWRVDSLADADQTFRIYYGNSTAVQPSAASPVGGSEGAFDAFQYVLLFEQDPSGGSLVDVSGNLTAWTVDNMVAGDKVTQTNGMAAYTFGGPGSNERVYKDHTYANATGTITALIKVNSLLAADGREDWWGYGGSGNTANPGLMALQKWRQNSWFGDNDNHWVWLTRKEGSGSLEIQGAQSAIVNGSTVLLSFVRTLGSRLFYENGVLDTTVNIASTTRTFFDNVNVESVGTPRLAVGSIYWDGAWGAAESSDTIGPVFQETASASAELQATRNDAWTDSANFFGTPTLNSV